MPESPEKSNPPKWLHPSEVMKLHKLKQKKKALQARIKGNDQQPIANGVKRTFENAFTNQTSNNPFVKYTKKPKTDSSIFLDESTDQTLFKLLNLKQPAASPSPGGSFTSFSNILNRIDDCNRTDRVEIVKEQGKHRLPIDWTLKDKVRLISLKPLPWSQKLKISEEASGLTAFARCLGDDVENNLDSSSNAKFFQSCLYFIHPNLPWLQTFPRSSSKGRTVTNHVTKTMKETLHQSWCDSLRSLFQLVRTKQCPFFYACTNNYTVLFRAAGINSFTDIHVLVTPTTRGFRNLLKQEDIEYSMPLKRRSPSDSGYESPDTSIKDEEDVADDNWMKSMGINDDDIKQINYSQDKIVHKIECEVDNSEESLVMIEGAEVHSFYNFLLNCKSLIPFTGPLAGVPPTLLAPVAFQGSTLSSLKIRENKVFKDNINYYSVELSGPILPNMMHTLFALSQPEHSLTATFNNIASTGCFSKLKNDKGKTDVEQGTAVFGKENLSDCGLLPVVLKHFCDPDTSYISNVECVKYSSENKTFTWS
ncbi:unnamed protein product [Phyllotreta striolata]|uniref:Uncharacterized protein n=1 Tax=Phyllotreta striolata TaxID=444603 RepID=A0A9N9XNV0_PHYSR|nr:unnamed protein product [Phyllotreta striolata]